MTRLVEDLLDISRITRGAIELRRETLDVGAEIRNAVESCHGAIEVGRHTVVRSTCRRSRYTSSPTACACSRSSRT